MAIDQAQLNCHCEPRAGRGARQSHFKVLILLSFVLLACPGRNQRVGRARKYIDDFDFREAEGELLPFRDSKDAEARYLLGICALAKRDLVSGRNHFQVAVQVDSNYRDSVTRVYLRSITKNMSLNDFQSAEKLFADLVYVIPDPNLGPEVRYLGEIYYREKNYKYAIPILEGVAESETSRVKIWRTKRMLIECYSQEREYHRALKLIEELIEDGLNGSLVIARGMNYYKLADYFKGLEEYDSAEYYARETIKNMMPKSLKDDSYFMLAEIYQLRGNKDKAVDFYRKVIKLNPYRKGKLVQLAKARIESLQSRGEDANLRSDD